MFIYNIDFPSDVTKIALQYLGDGTWSLNKRKKTKIGGIGAETGQKTSKTQTYYFGGRFLGARNNFFFKSCSPQIVWTIWIDVCG